MSNTEDVALAALVCARLCHDLGSPLGAILNGVDLIEELGEADASEEFALLAGSARRAAALLAFHRLAFGVLRNPKAEIGRDVFAARAETAVASHRVRLAWSGGGPALSLPTARLLSLMLLAGRATLGRGGRLQVLMPTSGEIPVAVIAEGERVELNDTQRGLLAARAVAPDSRTVEFALLPSAAAGLNACVAVTEEPGRIALRAVPM